MTKKTIAKKSPGRPRVIKIKTAKVKEVVTPSLTMAKEEAAPNLAAAIEVKEKYLSAVGRRKEAKARIRLIENGQGKIIINGRELKNYFPIFQLSEMILAPLKLTGGEKFDFSVKVVGGGKMSQAEAVRHGLARILVRWNADLKPILKKAGFLTRDPRVKERKKFGHKKARRSPQWAKR